MVRRIQIPFSRIAGSMQIHTRFSSGLANVVRTVYGGLKWCWQTRFIKVSIASALFFVSVALATGILSPSTANATAGIESELSFEGKIVTSAGQNIPDGTYNMEFKIYTGCTNNTGSGCTQVWTEDYLVSNSDGVSFTSGTYQVNLGQYCPFSGGACTPSSASGGNTNTAINWNSYPLYISLQIGNTSSCTPSSNNFTSACGGDGVMSPYVLLTSTPYAQNANEVGGFTASQLGQLAANNTWTGTNTIQDNSTTAFQVQQTSSAADALEVNTTSNRVGIGTSSPDAALSVQSPSENAVIDIYGVGATLDYGVIQVSSAGGVTNSSNRFLALQPNAGDVLIGTTTDSAKLTVAGNELITTNSSTAFLVQNTSSQSLLWADTSGNNVYIGAVGSTALSTYTYIGTSSSSSNSQAIYIGSQASSGDSTTIQGGSGSDAVSIQAATTGIISIGTANPNIVNIGSATGTENTSILGGTSGVGLDATGGVYIGNTDTSLVDVGNSNSGTVVESTAGASYDFQNTQGFGIQANSANAFRVQTAGELYITQRRYEWRWPPRLWLSLCRHYS